MSSLKPSIRPSRGSRPARWGWARRRSKVDATGTRPFGAILRCAGRDGFSSLELLIATVMFGLAITATSGFFLASNKHMKMQARKVETNQAARAAIDMIVRDLRLGGACLPVTGSFISLEGEDDGDEDELIVRTGLVRPDLSCVRTSVRQRASAGSTTVRVETVDGFEAGQRVYLRAPSNKGEYVKIASIDTVNRAFKTTTPLTRRYDASSGVYVIDERRYFINHWDSPRGELPELMVQIDDDEPISFAVGIEKLNFEYQLRRNCFPCDVVDVPANEDEWAIVEQILVSVTARSELQVENGDYYRRTIQVGVKPRNLLPR